MDWIQAAFDASEESEESNNDEIIDSAIDVPEKFDEKKFKENKELLKFGREHLQRIKNNESDKKIKSNRNDIKKPIVHINQDIFTLYTQREIKKDEESTDFNNDLKNNEIVVETESNSPKTIQAEPVNNILLQAPKGKEWKGFEKCTAHIYGENIMANSHQVRSNLGPLKEDLKSISFNLPVQTFTTSDGEVLQSNQIRRTQKRKHQINWLAMEAQEHEFELLQQTSHMRKSKRETQMKYGW